MPPTVLQSGNRLTRARLQVEWEFWTNSNDMCGAVCDVQREFIKVHLPSDVGIARVLQAETRNARLGQSHSLILMRGHACTVEDLHAPHPMDQMEKSFGSSGMPAWEMRDACSSLLCLPAASSYRRGDCCTASLGHDVLSVTPTGAHAGLPCFNF